MLVTASASPVAAQAIHRIAALYRVEADARVLGGEQVAADARRAIQAALAAFAPVAAA